MRYNWNDVYHRLFIGMRAAGSGYRIRNVLDGTRSLEFAFGRFTDVSDRAVVGSRARERPPSARYRNNGKTVVVVADPPGPGSGERRAYPVEMGFRNEYLDFYLFPIHVYFCQHLRMRFLMEVRRSQS